MKQKAEPGGEAHGLPCTHNLVQAQQLCREDLNRWMPLVKWFLAIPHYIVLWFLGIAAFVCVVIAWFAILFTGRYPRSLFDSVVGFSDGL